MDQSFIIKNNILYGEEEAVSTHGHELGQTLLNSFTDNPNHVGQIEAETEKETTFAEMKDNTIRCALWMRKQKIGKNDVVAICTLNHKDAYIPCIATFYVGAIYNAWEHNICLAPARHFIKLVRPKVIFVYESDVKIIKEAATLENFDVQIIVFGKYPMAQSLRDILSLQTIDEIHNFRCSPIESPKDIATILFSSGTTGLAKGVMHSYETLSRIAVNSVWCSEKQDVQLWYSPLNWITGTMCMLLAILTGATRILHAIYEPEEMCKVIQKFQVTRAFLSPTMLTHLYKSDVLKKFELTSLKELTTGGAKMCREIACYLKENLPYTQFYQVYGMTELGRAALAQNQRCKKIDSVGFIMSSTQLKIIDVDNGKILGPNQPGELCFKSSTMMLGYYKNPAATKAAIDEEGWLHTGDKGYYDENGEIFIVDRLKEIMKFRGHHVSLFEIEELLMSHEGVMEAAVVPVPHELDIERAMAFVKKSSNSKVTGEELVELSSELGNIKKLWGGVQFLKKIPYTASGKFDRKTLKEMAKIYAKEN